MYCVVCWIWNGGLGITDLASGKPRAEGVNYGNVKGTTRLVHRFTHVHGNNRISFDAELVIC